jgi:hypothetical protein
MKCVEERERERITSVRRSKDVVADRMTCLNLRPALQVCAQGEYYRNS